MPPKYEADRGDLQRQLVKRKETLTHKLTQLQAGLANANVSAQTDINGQIASLQKQISLIDEAMAQ